MTTGTSTKKPWDGIVSEEEQRAYRAAGFGKRTGLGSRPALLIIDVQYRTTGSKPGVPMCSITWGAPSTNAAPDRSSKPRTSSMLTSCHCFFVATAMGQL